MLSNDTIDLCLEIIGSLSVPVTAPDATAKMDRLTRAHAELLTERDGRP